MNKDDKILITGASGLVGSNLITRLEQEESHTNLLYPSHSELDLLDQRDVNRFVEETKPKYVFHCAATVGGIQANINSPYKFLYNNLVMQNNVINACIENNVEKVLFLASVCMYPTNYKQPLKEEYLLEASVEPTNEGYALSKICGTKLCQAANKQFNTKFIVLAPANLYGPGDSFDLNNSHVLSALIRKIYEAKENNKEGIIIWGSGKPKREFLYVDDLVDCMLWSMNNLEKTDTFLNVGTGEDISILELAKLIAEIIKYKGEFIHDISKPDGMMLKRSDVTKMNKLGWKAKTSLKEGIKKTINYYRSIR